VYNGSHRRYQKVAPRLWRNREASWDAQPWPIEDQPIPKALWKRLFKLRIRYHSLEDTLSAAVMAAPLSLSAERGNQRELVVGRKAVDHRRLPLG
jgi:hypothetical protein